MSVALSSPAIAILRAASSETSTESSCSCGIDRRESLERERMEDWVALRSRGPKSDVEFEGKRKEFMVRKFTRISCCKAGVRL